MGRILFNEVVPAGVGYINEVLTKKNLRGIIGRVLKASGFPETAAFLDAIKELGFENATTAGLTFSIADIVIPDAKKN
jgi:DNA-directed RNA polymerase subunit beta'